jgi:glucose-6-phosphate 1-epimerase
MTRQFLDLPVTTQITPVITERLIGNLPVLVVNHPKVHAALTLQGAHLLAWQPANQQPVIWLSDKTPFTPGVAIRGGVPICWPWFGPASTPAHGFARLLSWELTAHAEDEQGVLLTLTLKDSEESRQYWPHDFTLIARFKLGVECEIELESRGDYEVTSALHSYFTVGDIEKIQVAGLGKPYLDKVLQFTHHEQQGELTFAGQTDRIYSQPESRSLIKDPVLNRTIEVQHFFNTDVVAWNPGKEATAKMQDMDSDGYKTMVCVESASVSKPLRATPQAPLRLGTTIRLHQGV